MSEVLKKLRSKVFKNQESGADHSELTSVMELARGLSCLPDILGRDFEVMDPKGKVIYKIRQKPMSIKQLNYLLKEFNLMMKRDYKRKPAKWGNSHTEEKNLVKGLPGHLRGSKIASEAIKELYKLGFLTKSMKTGEWHVSLNPRKKEEICRFLGLPPRV